MLLHNLLEMYVAFLKVGVGGFGGGAASLGLLQRELVVTHGLLTQEQVGNAIAVATMMPGPVAVNASALAGFEIAGFLGALVGVLGLLTPPAIIAALVVTLLLKYSESDIISRIRHALRPGALGLVAYSVYTVANAQATHISDPTQYLASLLSPLLPIELFVIENIPKLLIAVTAFSLFVWKKQKVHPALAIIGFGLLGILIF